MRLRFDAGLHRWDAERWCWRATFTIDGRERCWLDITRHYGLRVALLGFRLWNTVEN